MVRIHGVLLPDGVEREVFIAGGRFTFEPEEGARTVVEDAFLVPGLVDGHAHLALASPALRRDRTVEEHGEFRDGVSCAAALVRRDDPGDPWWAVVVSARAPAVPATVAHQLLEAAADLSTAPVA